MAAQIGKAKAARSAPDRPDQRGLVCVSSNVANTQVMEQVMASAGTTSTEPPESLVAQETVTAQQDVPEPDRSHEDRRAGSATGGAAAGALLAPFERVGTVELNDDTEDISQAVFGKQSVSEQRKAQPQIEPEKEDRSCRTTQQSLTENTGKCRSSHREGG